LSGGNQQKVVVSRNLDQTPELLVAANPTRGLDIRAADFVQRQILKARAEGAAVLLISTDMDELAGLADRTLFISRGELREASDSTSLLGGP
jgi:simple sugar transport system ATP-binding protein